MSTPTLPTIYDQMDGKPNADFVECEGCEPGVVEREMDYFDYDGGPSYRYLRGSRPGRCAVCAATERVSA